MMQELIRQLYEGNHSLVIGKGSDIRTFDRRGIADLYEILKTDPALLSSAAVADKVVGKAAAALMILGGVTEVFAQVISEPALSLFKASSVKVSYGETTHHIINRTNTGWCPMETRCKECNTANECLIEIEQFMNEIKNNKQTN